MTLLLLEHFFGGAVAHRADARFEHLAIGHVVARGEQAHHEEPVETLAFIDAVARDTPFVPGVTAAATGDGAEVDVDGGHADCGPSRISSPVIAVLSFFKSLQERPSRRRCPRSWRPASRPAWRCRCSAGADRRDGRRTRRVPSRRRSCRRP